MAAWYAHIHHAVIGALDVILAPFVGIMRYIMCISAQSTLTHQQVPWEHWNRPASALVDWLTPGGRCCLVAVPLQPVYIYTLAHCSGHSLVLV